MAKQRAPLEFNQLSGGLITEASALTFPDSASLDEVNFELSRKGSRRRRYGIEYEPEYTLVSSPEWEFIYDEEEPLLWSSFTWKNVGGQPSRELMVVQINNKACFFSLVGDSISESLVGELTLNTNNMKWSYASIDGSLVIAYGGATIYTIRVNVGIDGSLTFSKEESRLKVRDLFGVKSYVGERELTDPINISYRPTEAELGDSLDNHLYNLLNQTFAVKRMSKSGSTVQDCINLFKGSSGGKYPANSDAVTSALYANTANTDNPTIDRFHQADLIGSQQGSFPASKGFFIIDLLNRSADREAQSALWSEDNNLSYTDLSLPNDSTTGGATVVAEYGGRVWYGGFSEEGTPSDSGVTLEGYLTYSQSSNSSRDYNKCYQKGDPTSIEDPELLDTDGGFLALDGAYGVHKLLPIGNSLLAFATNGVWAVSGADGNYFAPTTPRVVKVSDRGSVSSGSIVDVGSTVVYWTTDGIYHISVTGAETYELNNITKSTIQSLYSDIPYTSKVLVEGKYDEYSSEIIWAVNNSIGRDSETYLIKMLTTTSAFTVHKIKDGLIGRTVLGPVEAPAFFLSSNSTSVTVGGEVVTSDGEGVYVNAQVQYGTQTSTKYLTIVNPGGKKAEITFSVFTEPSFRDWGEVDANGYMVTGYISGGDFQRNKEVPYITFHLERTETGFEYSGDGDIVPTNQSSCIVQSQWEWSDSANSGRWGKEFQAYRYRRLYMPSDVNDGYEYGFSTIVTKNKLRGSGKVLSMKISTEEAKDCRLLGWSAIMGVNSEV